MDRLIDLHLHSTASDGDFHPCDLPEMARSRGLCAMALTDHDTLSGIPDFLVAAEKAGIEAVPGVEVGIKDDLSRGFKEVHMLAYFVHPGDHILGQTLKKLQKAKVDWSKRQVQLLVDRGFELPYEEVLETSAGSPTVRRPHIWKVLSRHNKGRIEAQEYFRGTDFGGELHVSKDFEVTMEQAVKYIIESGGVPVLAHPAFYGTWPNGALKVLDEACKAGVKGVEAIYAYDVVGKAELPPEKEISALLIKEASERGLVVTGGSDFHGSLTKDVKLGQVAVPYSCIEKLKELTSQP